MRRTRTFRVVLIGIILALIPATGALLVGRVDCPVVSSGGDVAPNGSLAVVGQFTAGAVTDGDIILDQGAVPCWVRGPSDAPDGGSEASGDPGSVPPP
jgi:hypothetical protein